MPRRLNRCRGVAVSAGYNVSAVKTPTTQDSIRERVVFLHRRGWPQKRIAKELGISAVSVCRHIRMAGTFLTPHGYECGFSLPRQRKIVCDYLMGRDEKSISRELCAAEYRVRMVLWRHGLPDREVLVAVRRRQAVWMSKAGRSVPAIAACFGVCRATVASWLKQEGHHAMRITDEMRAEAVASCRAGGSYYAVAKRLGVSPSSVRNWAMKEQCNG